MSGTPDLAECLQVAEQIAKEAGKYVLEGFHSTKTVDTKIAPWDLVTEYDKGTEKIVVSALKKKFPTHKFIGEETEASQSSSSILTDEPTWIIDPIDGTTNFVHGFHETCISIGLAVNKEPVVGVIYNPVLDYMFTARQGNGAYLNNKRIHTSKCTELSKIVAVGETSSAKFPQHYEGVMARLEELSAVVQGMRNVGSAAMILCYVANGSIGVFQLDGLQMWDVAAGTIIVREAGGIALHTSGSPFELTDNKYLYAGNKSLADQFVAVIKRADARFAKKGK